jgi:hypothetical protein
MNLTKARRPFSFPRINLNSGVFLGGIIITALLSFEMFNYSTTDFALRDLLGDLKFLGFQWATILAIAFCGIDFAGIARLFTPQQGADEPREVWYLFGAWFLAATMNAMLTWWAISMAIVNHEIHSTSVLDSYTLVKIVPVFIAVMIWIIRILIIGAISITGERIFSPAMRTSPSQPRANYTLPNASASYPSPAPRSLSAAQVGPRPGGIRTNPTERSNRPEPTYQRSL